MRSKVFLLIHPVIVMLHPYSIIYCVVNT